eukprot:jgi/Mesen1/7387/ME000382S06583
MSGTSYRTKAAHQDMSTSSGGRIMSMPYGNSISSIAVSSNELTSDYCSLTAEMVYAEYTWVFVLATIFSFACAFGIGANDVANSFASSVGAKAITLQQALLIAAVCEFSGSMGLGAGVTNTIKNNIAKIKQFDSTPDLLMVGLLCCMVAAAFWDNFACQLELPVSTTHTTIGAIVGMAIVLRGGDAVVWSKEQDPFPYVTGMTPVFLSWVVSPVASGICVLISYGLLRTVVLRSEHSFKRAQWVLPICVALTFFVVIIFIIQTGNKNHSWDPVKNETLVWIAAVVAAPIAILTAIFIVPMLVRKIEADDELANSAADKALEEIKVSNNGEGYSAGEVEAAKLKALADLDAANSGSGLPGFDKLGKWYNNWSVNSSVGRALTQNVVARTVLYGSSYKVHDAIGKDETVAAVWEHAEVHDYKTERLFRYLQVFSAMVMSFAHGANDVANAVGPYAGIYQTWKTGKVPSKAPVPQWIYAMGGGGIVLGLATYGYKIMKVLGVKAAKLTNTRGFCAEISTATVVIVASRYGLPVSTTQIITGAILAIGLFEGAKGVNWKVIFRTFVGWVLTIIVAGFIAGGLSALLLYAPSKIAGDDINSIKKILFSQIKSQINQLNQTTLLTSNPTLGATLSGYAAELKRLNTSNQGYSHPLEVTALQQQVFTTYNSTLF